MQAGLRPRSTLSMNGGANGGHKRPRHGPSASLSMALVFGSSMEGVGGPSRWRRPKGGAAASAAARCPQGGPNGPRPTKSSARDHRAAGAIRPTGAPLGHDGSNGGRPIVAARARGRGGRPDPGARRTELGRGRDSPCRDSGRDADGRSAPVAGGAPVGGSAPAGHGARTCLSHRSGRQRGRAAGDRAARPKRRWLRGPAASTCIGRASTRCRRRGTGARPPTPRSCAT